MWVSIALCVAAALVGAVCAAECGACIHGQCYRKHHLPNVKGYPLDIDRNTSVLYTYDESDGKTFRQCHLDTGVCNNISNTQIWSLTVNQRDSGIYGSITNNTASGIYKLNLINNENKLLVRGEDYHVTFKEKLYYTSASGNGIFTYDDGETRIVAGTKEYNVLKFIVDKKDDIYFRTRDNITRLSKGVIYHSVYWDNNYLITVDRDGNAVFIRMDSHAVYKVTDGQLTEVGVINDSIYEYFYEPPMFDRYNNVIYKNNSDDYYHLKRDRGVECTYSILQNKYIITETAKTTENYTENDSIVTTPTLDTTSNSSPDGSTGSNTVLAIMAFRTLVRLLGMTVR